MRLRTAPALPVPAHVMSGVSPVAIAEFGLAPAFSRRSTMAALRIRARQRQRRRAKVVGRVGVRSGANQEIGGLEIVPVRGPEQRRRPVERPYVGVGALLQQPCERSPDRCCAPPRRDANPHPRRRRPQRSEAQGRRSRTRRLANRGRPSGPRRARLTVIGR